LNITVPQVGHLPLMAFRPFFMVSSTALTISFLALHLTQYPSGIENIGALALHAPRQLLGVAYGRAATSVNSEKAGVKPLSSNNPAKFRSKDRIVGKALRRAAGVSNWQRW
jgi:hypothetical protein